VRSGGNLQVGQADPFNIYFLSFSPKRI
jgi:hypothetical protein